jgi:LysM repeat protein
MYQHPVHAARKPSRRAARLGVTASAVAVATVGFAGVASAQDRVEVEQGDTLATIGAEHGADWQEIVEATPDLPNPDVIVPGQEVVVPSGDDDAAEVAEEPAEEGDTHVVDQGESLADVADEHGLDSWRPVFDANEKIADPNVIVPGQELEVPAPGEDVPPRGLPAEEAPAAEEPVAEEAPVEEAPVQEAPPAEEVPQEQTATTSEPAPEQDTQPATSAPAGVWDRLAECESGGNWGTNTGNGYYGGLQFDQQTWESVGGQGSPHEASRDEQIARAEQLRAQRGFQPWPACSQQLGLR